MFIEASFDVGFIVSHQGGTVSTIHGPFRPTAARGLELKVEQAFLLLFDEADLRAVEPTASLTDADLSLVQATLACAGGAFSDSDAVDIPLARAGRIYSIDADRGAAPIDLSDAPVALTKMALRLGVDPSLCGPLGQTTVFGDVARGTCIRSSSDRTTPSLLVPVDQNLVLAVGPAALYLVPRAGAPNVTTATMAALTLTEGTPYEAESLMISPWLGMSLTHETTEGARRALFVVRFPDRVPQASAVFSIEVGPQGFGASERLIDVEGRLLSGVVRIGERDYVALNQAFAVADLDERGWLPYAMPRVSGVSSAVAKGPQEQSFWLGTSAGALVLLRANVAEQHFELVHSTTVPLGPGGSALSRGVTGVLSDGDEVWVATQGGSIWRYADEVWVESTLPFLGGDAAGSAQGIDECGQRFSGDAIDSFARNSNRFFGILRNSGLVVGVELPEPCRTVTIDTHSKAISALHAEPDRLLMSDGCGSVLEHRF